MYTQLQILLFNFRKSIDIFKILIISQDSQIPSENFRNTIKLGMLQSNKYAGSLRCGKPMKLKKKNILTKINEQATQNVKLFIYRRYLTEFKSHLQRCQINFIQQVLLLSSEVLYKLRNAFSRLTFLIYNRECTYDLLY